MWVSTVRGVSQSRWPIPRSVRPSAIQLENFAFAVGEPVEWAVLAPAADEGRHELRVDDGLPGRHPPDGIRELPGVEHPVLEEVAGVAFAALDQA